MLRRYFTSTMAENENYLRLKEFSPAIGAGNNDYVNNATPPITTDAAGAMRIQSGMVDLGAYESAFVTPMPQTLVFTLTGDLISGNTIPLKATSQDADGDDITADGLPAITYMSSDNTIAEVRAVFGGGQELVLKAPGLATITASRGGGTAGGVSYAAATPVTQDITVEEAPQTLTFVLAGSGISGNTIPLTTTSQDADGTDIAAGLPAVTYTSSEENVALVRAVEGGGQELVLLMNGTTTITASRVGGTIEEVTYAAATPVTQDIMVSAAAQTLVFTLTGDLISGNTIPLTAISQDADGTDITADGLPVITYMSSDENVAEVRAVSGGGQELVLLMNGTTTITVSRGEGTVEEITYAAATAVTQEITVSAATQTLSFPPPNNPVLEVGNEITLTATTQDAGGDDIAGLEVTLAITSAGTVATFNAVTGVLTFVGVGSVTVTASRAAGTADGVTYAAATDVEQTFTVTQGTQTVAITSGNTGQATTTTIALTATVVNALGVDTGSDITYEIVSETPTRPGDDVADLPAGTNMLALIRPGTVEIRATAAGDVNTYAEATDTQEITVTDDPVFPQTFTFNLAAGGTSGDEITLTATSQDAGGTEITGLPDVTFAITPGSNNPTTAGENVATLAADVLTLASPGMISITASRAGGRGDDGVTYAAATAVTQPITVAAAMQTLTFDLVADGTSGTTLALTATAQDVDGNDITAAAGLPAITYTSSDERVAMVRATGGGGQELLLLADGTATITALREGGTVGGVTYAPADDVTQDITVGEATQTLVFTLQPDGISGAVIALTATAQDASGNDITAAAGLPAITYTSDAPDIAEVRGGQLVLLMDGTATITASRSGGTVGGVTYAAATAVTQPITVSAATQTLVFTLAGDRTSGDRLPLTATSQDADGNNISAAGLPAITYMSSEENVAEVRAVAGGGQELVLLTPGTTIITASRGGGTAGGVTYAPADDVTQDITVEPAVPTAQVIAFDDPTGGATVRVGESIDLVATTDAPSDAMLAIAFTSSATNIAVVVNDDDGTFSLRLDGTGDVTITATQAGGIGANGITYAPATATQTITVAAAAAIAVDQEAVFVAKTAIRGTFEIFSTIRWQLSKSNTGAEWITNIAADGGNSDASSITGENDASITITTIANPNNTGRSTTLTLTAIDQTGNTLTEPAPVTISFTQLGTTHTGDISVTTQAEVDALRTSLRPGTTLIMGNVTIGLELTTSDITDLSPFAAIIEVTGSVVVKRNRDLPNLMGLNQLESIEGDFEVSGNDALTSLGDFPALESIGGGFAVENNGDLTSLGDFAALQTIGGGFAMGNNGDLTSLGDFTALQTIGGGFEVVENGDLPSLGNFTALQTISGGFEMSDNDALTSLGNFPALQTIGGGFEVSENGDLPSLGGFTVLQSIGSIFKVSGNDLLTSLGDFPVLQTIGGDFEVGENAALASVRDFTVLQTIGGSFEVSGNAAVTSVRDFTALQTIRGSFEVSGNAALNSVRDFPVLQSIGDDFEVSGNADLTSLGNFAVLQSIGGSFEVSGTVALPSQGDFPALQTIGGSFEIYNNAALTSPGEFFMLTSIGSANGIPVPSTGTDEDNVSILVEGNALLQDCCVLTTFFSDGANAVSGQIFIGDNASGCSSTAEVNCAFLKTDLEVVFTEKATTEGVIKGMFEIFSTLPWQLSKPTTEEAKWITNIAAGDDNSDASSITGENNASITITAAANPENAVRSMTLTLTAMDMAGEALTDPPPVTILFTQLGATYEGDFTLEFQTSATENKKSSSQRERMRAALTNVTAIRGNLIIGNYNVNNDITELRPLRGITHVTGNVEVVSNSRLVSLGFLADLQAIGGNLLVENNNLLEDCCTLAGFLSGETNTVSGRTFIDDNASGCGTTTQVNCEPFLKAGKKVVLAEKTATESTLEAFSRKDWQLSKPGAEVEWITNMEAEGSTSNPISIMGENNAFITITTTVNPKNTGRRTKLTLKAINMDDDALTKQASITVPFTQLGISHTGNVSVATQAEVDALSTSLTTDATRIKGNVTIGSASGMSDIDDLSQFADIIEITGNVVVRGNLRLTSLAGLSQLQIIGGSFGVNRNAALTSLGDFTDLESIGGSFVVGGPSSDDGNATLLSLGDFRTLQTIGGSFVVERNRSLTSLGDFRALHTIDDSFVVSSFALTSLGDFTKLQTIKGDFEVNFTALPSLNYFTALQSIGGTFVVNINDALTSLGNFPALQIIGDDFEVTKNTTLTSLGNFSALQSISGDFEVTKNDILTSLGDFPALEFIGGIFEVGGNAALTSLGNFAALKGIGGDFDVIDNDVLKSLGDFTKLQFIGDFEVGNNFALTSLGNFPALQFMGDFFVEVNDGLESLGDFPVLESIDGSFVMNYNDGLTSLGDFTALQTIGGSFGVVGTSALTSLGGFPALQTIGSGLVMDFNAALTSLGEFPALESIGSVDEVLVLSTGGNQDDVSILVENNDLLEECCVLTTFFSGSTNAVSGQVIIFNNATGCSSRAEINTCGGGSPSIRRVTTTGDALGDGSDWTKAMTLQAALEVSTTVGDQVWIAEGTYKPDATDRAVTFTIPAGVLVYGGFVGTEADDFDPESTARTGAATILSGDLADNDVGREEADYNALRNDNSYSVVTVTGPGATLDGVTITAGESGTSGVGGGLYAVLGAATNMMVKDCLFTNNNADNSGGGAYFTESTILTGCTFTDNTAVENGGGAFFDAVLLGEASRLTDCTFTGNEAGKDGGGAYFGGVLFGEAATLTGCTFTDNTTEESGGGTYFSFGEVATLMGCTFKGNEAGKGGGMFIEEVEEAMLTGCIFTGNEAKYSYGGGAGFSETAMLTNCVVAGNSAAGSGGGLVFSTGGTVINSTFYNNTTDTQGGGIAVFFNDTHVMVGIQTNSFTLQNSILIDNTATTAGDAVYLVYEAPLMPSNIEATIDRNLLGSGMADLGVGVYDRVTSIYTDDRLANAWNVTLSNTIKESDAAVVFASTDAVNADYLRVAAGSPAVNSGNNNYIPTGITTDAVGNIRIQGGRIDLGAYESDVKLTQEISFIAPAADESGTVGQTIPISLTAMTTAMGLFVTFSIDPATGVATLTDNGDGTGSLTLDGAGTVIVTASQAGNATYESATPVTRTITVTKQSQVITFDDPTGGATVRVGQTIPLAATTDAPGLFVSFSIDPAAGIATLTDAGDGTGSLTLDDVGTVMVTASQAGDATYAPAADVTHTITVEAVLGIEEATDGFVLYPNPTSGKLHFSEQVAEFRLYGIEGRLLEIWKNVRSVDLSARHAGLYFAEVIRGGRSVRYRIMRE